MKQPGNAQAAKTGRVQTIYSGCWITDQYKQMLADGETPEPTNRFERRRLRDALKAHKNGDSND